MLHLVHGLLDLLPGLLTVSCHLAITSLDRYMSSSLVVTLGPRFSPAKTDKFVWQNVNAIRTAGGHVFNVDIEKQQYYGEQRDSFSKTAKRSYTASRAAN